MRRGTLGLWGIMAVVGVVASTLTTVPASAADERDAKVEVDNVQTLGQSFITLRQESSEGSAVASVHGVRRIPKGTVLYWSVGYPKDMKEAPLGGGSGVWPNWFAYDRYGSNGEPRGVSVIDPVGRKVYEPLITGEDKPCICSKAKVSGEKGDVSVLYAVVPELPADVTTVDVRLGFGSIIQDVPVEDGLLEPAAPADDRIVLLGQTWPLVDVAAVSSSFEPQKAIYPMITTQGTKDDTIVTQEEPDEVTLNLAADVLFAIDKASLTSRAGAVIAAAADQLNAQAKGGAVTVVGYTDSDGSDSYNQTLSVKRAEAVATALRKQLRVSVTLKTAGRGESDPVASNKSEKGKSLNRRVSVTFVPKGSQG
jgi:outer membrane protein OmpA-like peptidoglycan-associated protein